MPAHAGSACRVEPSTCGGRRRRGRAARGLLACGPRKTDPETLRDGSRSRKRSNAVCRSRSTRPHLDFLGSRYEGKVRDNYTTADGRRIIVVTDRISAFDRVLGTLPFKGQMLNRLAAYWFEQTRAIVPNHVIRVPDPERDGVRRVHAAPGRDGRARVHHRRHVDQHLDRTTSAASASSAATSCPKGCKQEPALARSRILTPSTKAEQGRPRRQTVSRERDHRAWAQVSAADFDEAAGYAMALFELGAAAVRRARPHPGRHQVRVRQAPRTGSIVVIDEIHTPDSSRFWFQTSYEERFAKGEEPESFDKEYVRRWLGGAGLQGRRPDPAHPGRGALEAARRYIEACETVQGRPFVPNLEAPGGARRTQPAREVASLNAEVSRCYAMSPDRDDTRRPYLREGLLFFGLRALARSSHVQRRAAGAVA